MNVRLYLLLAAIVVMASCASPSRYYKDFTSRKTSLQYLHDTPKNQKEYARHVQIATPVVTDSSFNGPGFVRTASSYFIPALIINEWGNEFDYRLGSTSIQQDVASFVRSAVITEGLRSGVFTPDSTLHTDDWVLEIEIDSIGGVGKYYQKGYIIFLLFAYLTEQDEGFTGSLAYVRSRYRLRQGDTILMEDVIYSEYFPETLDQYYNSQKVFRADFNTAIVEACHFRSRRILKRLCRA